MSALLLVVGGVVVVSFVCSLLESILLSVNDAYIETLIVRGRHAGGLLRQLKERINDPISSILTLNTISNSAGAAIAGSLALSVFGSRWVALFSAILTFLILVFAEIIPKTIGATYWKTLAPLAAYTLRGMILILKPIVVPVNFIARFISRRESAAAVTRDEVLSAVRLGYLKGVIDSSEFDIVSNLFKLKELTVEQVMTPRTVVYTLPPDKTTGDVMDDVRFLSFSRIPLYDKPHNEIEGVVLRRDIVVRVAENKRDVPLLSLASKPPFMPETLSVYSLLERLISARAHLAIVINEYGDYVGIATMEDAIEALLGREIVDESDRVVDMRQLAKERVRKKH
ncbi:MAG: DUF21 domain-containing protein [Chitinivibrionales bacterium]|nr:DUF21 domain-containing protein [Chitinivibrionales bacterium]